MRDVYVLFQDYCHENRHRSKRLEKNVEEGHWRSLDSSELDSSELVHSVEQEDLQESDQINWKKCCLTTFLYICIVLCFYALLGVVIKVNQHSTQDNSAASKPFVSFSL